MSPSPPSIIITTEKSQGLILSHSLSPMAQSLSLTGRDTVTPAPILSSLRAPSLKERKLTTRYLLPTTNLRSPPRPSQSRRAPPRSTTARPSSAPPQSRSKASPTATPSPSLPPNRPLSQMPARWKTLTQSTGSRRSPEFSK